MSYTPKNLYPPFSSSSVNWGYWSQTSETLNGQPCFARSGAWQGLCNELYLDVGTYTYSCYIKSAALRERSALNIEPNNSSEYAHYSDRATIEYLYSEYFDIPGDNTWRRYYLIVRVTSAGYVAPRAESRFNLSTAMTISAPQLEVGDEMTDYEPYNCTWYIGLDGELHNTQFIDLPAAAMSTPYPHALWRITPGVNDGLPYNLLLPGIVQPTPPNLWIQPARPMIHVYGSRETDFETNGNAICEPISCEVHQDENGVYEATFETYCDEYGKYRYIRKQAHIRVPVRYHGELKPQVFRVREVTRRMDEYGNYRITATAQAKFYDLARYLIKDCRPTQLNGSDALDWLFGHGWYGGNSGTEFSYSSDITDIRTAYYQNINVVNALLGADQCFVNRWGGKLYRNNLYFSLNKDMEGMRTSGVIVYGYNMTEIELTEDDTQLITVLEAEDNFGNTVELVADNVPSEAVPHHIYGYAKFTYDVEDVDAFHADAQAYFDEHRQSQLNITVRFANLTDLELYADFLALDDYEVGDRITIYHKDLDIYYANLEIISKTYDVVAQRTQEIQIGSLRNAITTRPYMAGTVSSGSSVEDKTNAALTQQIYDSNTAIMAASISGMEGFAVYELEKRTIAELEG